MSLQGRVDAVIDAALGNRIVGCVVLVRQNGQPVYARAAGFFDREAGLPMMEDAIFRFSSLTKPIVATTALRMVDAGLLRLESPVTDYLPWFTPALPDGTKPDIQIRHLLTHTSGLARDLPPTIALGLSGPIFSLEENLRRLAEVPMIFAPGTAWDYGRSMDVLGQVLATINGSDVEGAVSKFVSGPLGLVDSHFDVSSVRRLTVAYADDSPPRRMKDPDTVVANGDVCTFSPGRILNSKAPQSGGNGMAGTANDMMKLLEVYQPGSDFLREETRQAAMSNQIRSISRGPNDAGKGFGFIGSYVLDRAIANTPCSNGSTDWGGVYGHSWAVDPVRQITFAMCSNTALEGCLGKFPVEVRDAIFAEA